jgi:type II secretory pathway component PulJ
MRAFRPPAPAGFTVIEMTVAAAMLALLASLLGATWVGLCRPALESAWRCRLAQEANLAANALARDLGGTLANPEGRLGGLSDGVFVARMVPTSTWLRLCFHGGSDANLSPKWGAPDTVISYQLQANTLVRWDENSGAVVTIARDVSGFSVTPLEDNSGLAITLAFSYRGLSLTYDLVTVDPPQP